MTQTMGDKTMQAVVNFAPDPHSVELRELSVPEIGDEDVLVAVKAVGVCGSDVHQYESSHSWAVNYPVVLGHEFSGVIAAVGSRVTAFAEGDRVTSETAAVLDATSPLVRSGRYNLDPGRRGFGYGVDGAMAGFVRVPERCIHLLPPTLSFETAALAEPCSVAYNAVCVSSRIRPGDAVVVVGPGTIGLCATLLAALSGASPLVVVGTAADGDRLALATALGATHVVAGAPAEVAEQIKDLTDGYGPDLVVDSAGVSATLALALDLVRPGGQVTKVGWGPKPYGFSLDPLVAKAVNLQGSFSHTWAMWEKVLHMLATGQLDPSPLVQHVGPLSSWREGFLAMHEGRVVKAVLKP
ncbi:MAG: zinc-binding dehydrogenase [Actinomycetota bacterium]|nr:zinc-binding dehydrogenase [Actinomycetota bacterium]